MNTDELRNEYGVDVGAGRPEWETRIADLEAVIRRVKDEGAPYDIEGASVIVIPRAVWIEAARAAGEEKT